MGTQSRLAIALGALLLIPALVLPLWSIRIVAPQYKEGLGMYIGAGDIWGHTEHDIQNINILNHYIGMKPIVPEEVGVLAIMPLAVGLLVVTGLGAALIGRRSVVWAWLGIFAALGIAGLYEFWSWNYDYGHNLSPDAPIKVPGMTYQPPLIGVKTLLTIRASSLPSWGTLFVMMSYLLGVAALLHDRRPLFRRRKQSDGTPAGASKPAAGAGPMKAAAAVLLALLVTACGSDRAGRQAADVAAWADGGVPSDYCEGVIPEERFGGEVITPDRTYRFMSVECMAGFLASGLVEPAQVSGVRVVDYNHGERLIDAEHALYVRSQFRASPNGLNLLATDDERIAANLHYFFGGQRLSWPEVLELVRVEWNLLDQDRG
jgi:copper chaperone NosL